MAGSLSGAGGMQCRQHIRQVNTGGKVAFATLHVVANYHGGGHVRASFVCAGFHPALPSAIIICDSVQCSAGQRLPHTFAVWACLMGATWRLFFCPASAQLLLPRASACRLVRASMLHARTPFPHPQLEVLREQYETGKEGWRATLHHHTPTQIPITRSWSHSVSSMRRGRRAGARRSRSVRVQSSTTSGCSTPLWFGLTIFLSFLKAVVLRACACRAPRHVGWIPLHLSILSWFRLTLSLRVCIFRLNLFIIYF